MPQEKSTTPHVWSTAGLVSGILALLLVVVHFWAGPFSPTPPLEQVVAQKAVTIRDATVARLRGQAPVTQPTPAVQWDTDRVASLCGAVLGALALVLAAVGFARREPLRACASALMLGAGALAFQLIGAALGVLIVVILIAAVLSSIGGWLG